MIRKLLATATLAVLGLLWLPAIASGGVPPYPAPPVTPETTVPTTFASSVPTGETVTSLASTGAGFNVGLVVLIAAVVLVVGIGLLVMGRRSRKSGAQH
jgi:hypothetical protein